MHAEIIAIGDEVLIGQTVDTNSTFIARQLTSYGIKIVQKRVVADDRGKIVEALDSISEETDLVFMTGGLGPTKDDITKNTLNDYFGGKLEFRPEIYDHIIELFKSFNRVPSEVNRNQAYLPDVCEAIPNKLGTASGMRFMKDDVYYFSLPGVPYETEYLVEKKIMPWIDENFQGANAVHKTIITQGVPESDLAEKLEDWENNLPPQISLAYLPSPGMVKLRLSSYTVEKERAQRMIEKEVVQLKEILGEIIFGDDAESLEEIIGKVLSNADATVSTAESCTGGYIAHLITKVPGSSAYYNGSLLTYSNEAKVNLLQVSESDLEEHGAVSQPVVEQMAIGAREHFNTTYAVSTSGVAGPDGGSKEKPVGTVWIAIAGPNGVKSRKFSFGRGRIRNIQKSALMALDMLRRELQKIHA